MHTHTRACSGTLTYTLTHTYTCPHMFTHTHAHTHTFTHAHTHTQTHTKAYSHTCSHSHLLTYSHTHVHTHTHAHTHLHTLTHAHTHKCWSHCVPISPLATPSPPWEPGPGRRGPQCSARSWAAAGRPARGELAVSPHVCSRLPFLGSASDRLRKAGLKHHGESALLPLLCLPSWRGPVSVG